MTIRLNDRLTDLDDAELARRAGRREGPDGLRAADAAFQTLYHRYATRLLSYVAARVGRSQVEDVSQDVWVKVWEKLGEPQRFDGKNFGGWLFVIAHNLIVDRSRRPKLRNPQPSDGERADHREKDPHEVLAESERRDALGHCMDRLNPEERAVVQGRLGNEEYDSIATSLALPVKRLYKLLDQAKDKLTACLERSGQ